VSYPKVRPGSPAGGDSKKPRVWGEKRGRPWSTREKLVISVALAVGDELRRYTATSCHRATTSRAASLALLEASRAMSGDRGVACGGISFRTS
jgi:hypothetical protein